MICRHNANDSQNLFTNFLNPMAIVVMVAGGFVSITSVATAQQPPAYKQVETSQRYQTQSTEPRLMYAGGEPYFQELSDAEIREIEKDNKDSVSAINADKKAVEKILESGGNPTDELVKKFFNGYVFAEMTQTSHDKISRLGTMRNEFLNNFCSRKVTGTTRGQFIEKVVMPAMRSIHANTAFHPAVRLNAVYMIAMLDSQAPNRTGSMMTIPSELAYAELDQLLGAANAPTYLKVAALAGFERHVKIDSIVGGQIPPNKKKKLFNDLTAILAGSAPGQENWEPEIDYWLKRRSVQILGQLRSANALDPILAILKSPDAGTWLRFDAMQAIDLLNLSSVSQPKIKETTLAITQFVASNLAGESKAIRARLDDLIYSNMLFEDIDLEVTGTPWGDDKAAMPGGGMMHGGIRGSGMFGDFGPEGGAMDFPDARRGGRGRPGIAEEEKQIVELPTYELNVIRRRIKAFAFTGRTVLKNGTRGLRSVADPETASFIDGVATELSRLLELSDAGITNLEIPPPAVPAPAETRSIAEKLAGMCTASADQLDRAMGIAGGGEAVEPVNNGAVPDFDPAATATPAAPSVPSAPPRAAQPKTPPPAAADPLDGPDFSG